MLLLIGNLNAKEIAGVELPNEVRLDGIDQVLYLNGAGVRKKFLYRSMWLGKKPVTTSHKSELLSN